MSATILIVEDEETLRESLGRLFKKSGYRVDTAGAAEDALGMCEDGMYDVIISDILLPGMDGIEMMGALRETLPEQVFIIMTAYASLDTAVRALRAGAYDYIMKPVMHEEIKQVVKNAIRERDLRRENVILKRQVNHASDFSQVVGESPAVKKND